MQKWCGFVFVAAFFCTIISGCVSVKPPAEIAALFPLAIPAQFDDAGDFYQGVAAIRVGGVWGYIDKQGSFVIEPKYRDALDFHEELAAVKVGDLWGYINPRDIVVIKPKFVDVSSFSEGLACVWLNKNKRDGVGYIDKQGRVIPEFLELEGGAFHEGLVLWGVSFIDKAGGVVIESGKHHGDQSVTWQGKHINYSGYNTAKFYSANEFHEGLARVSVRVGEGEQYREKEYRVGFINKFGRYAVNPMFREASDFSEGVAAVKLGDKWGYVDKRSGMPISPQFDYAGEFHEGMARVEIGYKWGFVKH